MSVLDLEAIHKRIIALEANLAGVNSQVSGINDQLSQAVQSSAVGGSVHASIQSSIDEITGKVTTISSHVQSLASDVHGFGTRLTALENALGVTQQTTSPASPPSDGMQNTAAKPAS